MAYYIDYILLHIVWSVASLNIFYLRCKVSGGKCCGLVVTVIDPVNDDLSVFCCYFELHEQNNIKLNTWLIYVVAEGNGLSDNMAVIIKCLLASTFYN